MESLQSQSPPVHNNVYSFISSLSMCLKLPLLLIRLDLAVFVGSLPQRAVIILILTFSAFQSVFDYHLLLLPSLGPSSAVFTCISPTARPFKCWSPLLSLTDAEFPLASAGSDRRDSDAAKHCGKKRSSKNTGNYRRAIMFLLCVPSRCTSVSGVLLRGLQGLLRV